MKCSNCSFENKTGSKFCNECGRKLEIPCPGCGGVNQPGSKFCNECGKGLQTVDDIKPVDYKEPQTYTPKHLADKILTTRSAIKGERKLVTVLFADIANFTSISEKLEPEEIHQIMDGCFKILMDEIHKFEGTINQFTGDGVMALFGAPVAHEDHAHRSCLASLSIQNAMGSYSEKIKNETGVEFKMRIGINSGPVIVGAIGDDLRMDYTAVGDTTNLGSRMESNAKPGGILISENTFKLVKDYFVINSLGEIEVKGKVEPQEAFELLKTGNVQTRIGASAAKGLTRFVGREKSMAILLDAFEKSKAGSGQVIGIVGEAGVGKSRLLLEMRSFLPQGKYIYLEGRCLHYGGSISYLPILDILKSFFNITEGDREFIINKKMNEKILELDGNLKNVISPFQDLLSLNVDAEAFRQIEPKKKRETTFEAIRDILIRASQDMPLIIAVEDLHWMDKTSGAFLDYLIGWLANVPIQLILLYRPEYTHQWGSKSYYSQIGLDQLGTESSGELVKAILEDGDVAPELKNLILNRSAGNPLFLEEFTHTLVENGSIEKRGRKFVLSGKESDIQVPDTIQGIIAARLDRLEDNLKRTMQIASVIGRDFAFRILQTITGMREELKSYLLNLQGLEFIYEKNLFPELEYIFKHALIQEVTYNSLLLKRRNEIHENIGNAIEKLYSERLEEFFEMLAYHYSKSQNISKACLYLKLSGDKASRNFSTLEAYQYYREAANLLQKQTDNTDNRKSILEIIQLTARLAAILGFPDGSIELMLEGEKLAMEMEDTKALAHFQTTLGIYYLISIGDPVKGRDYIEKGIEEADLTGESEIIIPATTQLIFSSSFEGKYSSVCHLSSKTISLIEENHAEHEQFGNPYKIYSVLQAMYGMSLAITGNFIDGKPFLEKGRSFALSENDHFALSIIEQCYSRYYWEKGDGESMIKHSHSCIEHMEKSNFLMLLGMAWGTLGYGYFFLGQLDLAKKYIEKGIKLNNENGMSTYLGFMHYALAEIFIEMGQTDKAMKYSEEALNMCQNNNENDQEAYALINLGRIVALNDMMKFEKARALILEGNKKFQTLNQTPGHAIGIFRLGELYANNGRNNKALENMKKAEKTFREMGMNYWIVKMKEAFGKL